MTTFDADSRLDEAEKRLRKIRWCGAIAMTQDVACITLADPCITSSVVGAG